MTIGPTSQNNTGLEALLALPTVAAEEYAAWQPGSSSRKARPRDGISADRPPALPEAERRLLRTIVENPGGTATSYAKLAHMSPSRAAAARSLLVEKGYIREHRVATGGRGRCAIILEPLAPGRDLIKGGAD